MSGPGSPPDRTSALSTLARDLENRTADALLEDAAVPHADVAHAVRILGHAGLDPANYDRALALLGAALYLGRNGLPATAIDACAALATRLDAPVRAAAAGARLLALHVLAGRDPGGVATLLSALGTAGLDAAVAVALHASLRDVAAWAPDLVRPEAAVPLLAAMQSTEAREELLRDVIEPVLLARPDRVDPATFERLDTFLRQTPSWRWASAYVAGRRGAPAAVRRRAEAVGGLDRGVQVSARRQLGRADARALVVQNIADGQGDEIIRVMPIVQALLAFNPNLQVVVVTARGYLYAHPRVHAVAIGAPDTVRQVLAGPFAAVLDFYEPNVPELNHDGQLVFAVERATQVHPPFLRVSADKGWNQFIFQRVEVALRESVREFDLDRPRLASVYDPSLRLLAALGIPIRLGEERPLDPPVLAGRAWPAAARAWHRLIRNFEPDRPVALVNPFGGGEPLKGYVDATLPRAARRLEALIEEGYAAVILPNGTPWGAAHQARALAALLGREFRKHVRIAPDPGARRSRMRLGREGNTAPYAAYRMRLDTYFVRRADLVMTVEGWMMHAAYLLGRPYRLWLTAHGHGPEWWPHGRSPGQRVAIEPPAAPPELDGVPLPDQPRKQALIFTLRQLAAARGPAALPYIRRALRSPDRDIRVAAAEALGAVPEPVLVEELRPLLRDAAAPVRAAAGRALMARPNRSPDPAIAELLAHVWLAEVPPNWGNVVGLGPAGRLAVTHAAQGDDPVLRREARRLLAQSP